MYQIDDLDDTIAAISTATGLGAIGVIRLSGPDALSIAYQCFKPKKDETKIKNYRVHYGYITADDGHIIDEVLLLFMRGPKSYTTQDVIEIHCHGGSVAMKKILERVLTLGARLAQPGEFTKRAFLNGRIDLTQAEAVLDVITSKTSRFLEVSHHQLKGELHQKLEEIRDWLMGIYVEIEAIINFPEDDIDEATIDKTLGNIDYAMDLTGYLLKSGDQGQLLKEGIKIVLCGKPNVGKSSLLNVLLKTERAIVSDVAGTTRDTIEETAQIKGIPFQLVDTAGILEPRDLIEEEAIKRSHSYIQSADLVIMVIDASVDLTEDDRRLFDVIGDKNLVVAINKMDLPTKIDFEQLYEEVDPASVHHISVKNKEGINQLESIILENVSQGQTLDSHGLMISNIRHIECLQKAFDAIEQAGEILEEGTSIEFASEQIKQAINSLDAITGKNVDQDLLDTIFSEFCIGK